MLLHYIVRPLFSNLFLANPEQFLKSFINPEDTTTMFDRVVIMRQQFHINILEDVTGYERPCCEVTGCPGEALSCESGRGVPQTPGTA